MTEEQIERRVETMTNALDRQLLSGVLTQTDYDAAIRELDQLAERARGWKEWPQ